MFSVSRWNLIRNDGHLIGSDAILEPGFEIQKNVAKMHPSLTIAVKNSVFRWNLIRKFIIIIIIKIFTEEGISHSTVKCFSFGFG